ncbi:hypothetical protein JXQ70_12680 [bacterium]|nr:hypothetical protein [bacterium]
MFVRIQAEYTWNRVGRTIYSDLAGLIEIHEKIVYFPYRISIANSRSMMIKKTSKREDSIRMGEPRIYYIGLLHFSSEPGAEVEHVLNGLGPFYNSRQELIKIRAEHIRIHEIPVDYQTRYNLIIDRSSHRLSSAVGILKMFAFRGVSIVNNPLSFWWFVDNKDAAYGMMRDLGLRVPVTYLLPQHTTPYLQEKEFVYHEFFDWNKMMSDIGFPCFIKPANGRGAFGCNRAENMDKLLQFYNNSGSRVMMVQQAISSPFPWHLRCLCIGRKITPMKFVFRKYDLAEYIYDRDFLEPSTEKLVIEQAQIINRAFGYEINTVEFIIDHEGIPWAIDFNNPVPDGRRDKLGDAYFSDYVDGLVSLSLDKAFQDEPSPFLPPLNEYAEIARRPIPHEHRYLLALEQAQTYYDFKRPMAFQHDLNNPDQG